MTEAITFKTSLTAFVDGDEVATIYRYHGSDDTQPAEPYSIEALGFPVPVTTEDFHGAVAWVKGLAELYAGLFLDVDDDDEDEDEPVSQHPVNLDHPDTLSAWTVDELTEEESDQEWVDRDGDHYRVIRDQWYISHNDGGSWYAVTDKDTELLTDYGPYVAYSPA
jgi:hypothetical protein